MKTISVSVDNETHRLARVRAAETGSTVSAMIREMLLETLKGPAEPGPVEMEMAKVLGCEAVYSEDLSEEQDYHGVRVANPFNPTMGTT